MKKYICFLFLLGLSNSAFDWVFNFGLHEGGEEVAYINYADCSSVALSFSFLVGGIR